MKIVFKSISELINCKNILKTQRLPQNKEMLCFKSFT